LDSKVKEAQLPGANHVVDEARQQDAVDTEMIR